jgi:hypothetical protein
MQRKQQVGECWVCVIFFACVCVGVLDSTTASDDPYSSVICVMCSVLKKKFGSVFAIFSIFFYF